MSGRVFITGVAGFLGSHLAESYRDAGFEVSGIDDLSGGFAENIPDGVEFRIANCLNRSSYSDLAQRSDLVVHCASAAYDGLSVFSPAGVYLQTLQSTVEVATASLGGHMARFVLCSSMARYGALDPPFTETMEPRPVTPYGWAKLSAERALANLCDLDGCDYAVAVPHNIIGPRQNYRDPYRNVAAIMINRMLRGEQPIIYGDGSQTRCFSFVDDVVAPLVRLGEVPSASRQIVNVGPDENPLTVLELAGAIARIIGLSLDPIFVNPRPHEVQLAICSSDKARELLGYRTTWTLEAGLRRMIEWIASRGDLTFRYNRDVEIRDAGLALPRTWAEMLL